MQLTRRTTINWVLATLAATQAPDFVRGSAPTKVLASTGYGKDPGLLKTYAAGELWPLSLTDGQKQIVQRLSDLIIPADEDSPAASAAAVPAFIDEWVSAPYPDCQRDRLILVRGLAHIDEKAQQRFGRGFIKLGTREAVHILDDTSQSQSGISTSFFAVFRRLTAVGYYTTPLGMKAIGYVGNIPSATFEGPMPDALKHVGLI